MPKWNARCTMSLVCLINSLAGCSVRDPDEGHPDTQKPSDSNAVQNKASLAAYDFATWTAWTMPITVCFTSFSGTPIPPAAIPTPSQYTNLKALSMAALAETWGTVPGVSFVQGGSSSCTSSSPVLHVELAFVATDQSGVCGPGAGAFCSLGGSDAPDRAGFFKGTLIHEVGHGLGLAHEHQRLDADQTACGSPPPRDIAAACTRCKAQLDASQPCSAADYNVCTRGTPVTAPQTFAVGSHEYDNIVGTLGNEEDINSLALLTPFDPNSVMNYCRPVELDYHTTVFDLLGLEMIYPPNITYNIGCQNGCFHSNVGVITRADGAVTTPWTERGGLNVKMISPLVPHPDVSSVSTANLPANTSTLTFNFRAPRTGSLLTASGTLLNSSSYHTAIVSAALRFVM